MARLLLKRFRLHVPRIVNIKFLVVCILHITQADVNELAIK